MHTNRIRLIHIYWNLSICSGLTQLTTHNVGQMFHLELMDCCNIPRYMAPPWDICRIIALCYDTSDYACIRLAVRDLLTASSRQKTSYKNIGLENMARILVIGHVTWVLLRLRSGKSTTSGKSVIFLETWNIFYIVLDFAKKISCWKT